MTLSILLTLLLTPGLAAAEGGIVAGTVRGTDGRPAAKVRVGVMAVPEAGRVVFGAGTLVSQGETDASGKFQIEEVPPGRYYIVAGSLQTPTFYPGVAEMKTAKTIQVVAKASVRDLDFQVFAMPPTVAGVNVPTVRVTGRIVLKNRPNPMPGEITIQAASGRPVFPGKTETIPVGQDGTFKIDLYAGEQYLSVVGLPTGYTVVSTTSGGTSFLGQPIEIKISTELLVTLEVGDTRPRYRVVALVREDTSDRPLAGERVELVSAAGDVQQQVVNAQGSVTFPGLFAGTYVLRLVPGGFEVPQKQIVITDSSAQVQLRARKKP